MRRTHSLTHTKWLPLLLVVLAASLPADIAKSRDTALDDCGSHYAPPFAPQADLGRRPCPPPAVRQYAHRHKGIGFEILDAESAACFVPDQAYRLLDELIDTVLQRVSYDGAFTDPATREAQALTISEAISNTLADRGFGLIIPTATFADALIERNKPGERERHNFDCDTGSMIFLTIAENLGAPLSLVEITLSSGAGHNYVRWQLDPTTILDWDMNGRQACRTPTGLPSYQGRSMTRTETLGYTLVLRAGLWQQQKDFEHAIADFHSAMTSYPASPDSFNNFAWLIATRPVADRAARTPDAITASERAVSIDRSASNLDTLACAYALIPDFPRAITIETEALKLSNTTDFQNRLALFKASKDCTGQQ